MATTVFPVQATTGSTDTTVGLNAAANNTLYLVERSFSPGIYTITCSSSVIAYVSFRSNISTEIIATQTVSGSVSVNLASTASFLQYYVVGGTNQAVTVTRVGASVSNTYSGTLDTLTTSQTYTATSTSGYGYAVVVGGGGGGGVGNHNCCPHSAGGGGSGGVTGGLVQLTGNIAVTIGSFGVGSTCCSDGAGNGGATSFGNLTANGGAKSIYQSNAAAAGGSPGGGAGGSANDSGSGNSGSASVASPFPFVVTGTTGGGSGGNGGGGAGSGIGTGGNAGGGNANGYGAGGGRTNNSWATGGNGSAGIVYVVRF